MLKDEGGRFQSVRTEEEFLKLFQLEAESLTDDERELAFELFREAIMQESSPALEFAMADLYVEQPVTMLQFLKDPYFLGPAGKTLFPIIIEDLIEMFSGSYQIAILGGSLGGGKTTQGVIAILRILYECSRLRNAHECFNIGSADYISLSCVSVTEDVAEREILSRLRGIIDQSPFFSEEFKPIRNTTGKGIEFPGKLLIPPGVSTASGIIGANTIGAFIDECVVAETLIKRYDGSQIRADEWFNRGGPECLMSFDFKKEKTLGATAYIKQSSVKDCYSFQINDVSELCHSTSGYSHDHPVLCFRDNGWTFVNASDVAEGELVAVYADKEQEASNGRKKSKDFREDAEYVGRSIYETKNNDSARDSILPRKRDDIRDMGRICSVGRVVKKEYLGKKLTYSVAVPRWETFVADGVVTHNTNFFHASGGAKSNDPRKSKKQQIEIIFEGIRRRMKGRFMKRGKMPGLIILASSKTHVDSFTDRFIRKSVDDPTVFVVEHAAYEVRPPEHFSGDKFRVAIGNETQMSRVLSEYEPNPEGMKVIEVPVEYKVDFEEDTDQSIRDVAGFSTVSISPFLARRERIIECIDDRVHPFNMEVWDQNFPGRIDWSKIAKQRSDGAWEPKINPTAPRHVHLDLSKNQDCTGLCVSHVAGFRSVKRLGVDENEYAPVIIVDFVLKVQAPTAGDIIYSEIRKLIYEFSRHGFFIKMISADQFQSLSVLQTLESQGYKTKLVSVDRHGPYEALKLAMYEGRLKFYNYPPLLKELRELQKNWKTGKVDHPEVNGSKDAADALAGTVATLAEAQYGVTDRPILHGDSDPIETEEAWVMDHPGMLVADEEGGAKPEWRKNAERAMEEKDKQTYDQQKRFDMPFITG